MVFVPKTAYDALPEPLAKHLHKTWHVGVPFEPDIMVLVPFGNRIQLHRLEGSGNWFADNITPEPS